MNRGQGSDGARRLRALVMINLAAGALLLSGLGGLPRLGFGMAELIPDYGRLAILNVIQIEYRYD